jgi:DNA-directed RNA polymerase specialized sigma24 family protein
MVLLRNFDGLSNCEVSQLLDIRPEAAKKRHARALIRLKKALSDSTSPWPLPTT